MWGVLFIILGLTLATLCIVSVFKNLVADYKLIDDSLKNVAVIALVIGIIVCSLFVAIDGIELNLALNQLNKGINLTKAQIQLLKAVIPVKIRSALISTVIGYIMYGLHVFLLKEIQKEIDKQIQKNSKNIWHF